MIQELSCSTKMSSFMPSPSHGSDSGVSDATSFAESLQSNVMEDFAGENVASDLNFPSFAEEELTGSSADIEIDDELTAYLLGDSIDQTEEESGCSSNKVVFNLPSHSNSEFKKSAAKKLKIFNETDLTEYDCDHQNISINSEPIVRKNPLAFFKDPANFNRHKKDVDIVTYVKSSADVDATADHIMRAVNDRSRKNAVQAKMNREKKKAYIQGLEKDIESLQKENSALKVEKKQMNNQISRLEDEVHYLRNILANSSALSGLLKNINGVKGVKLSSSSLGASNYSENNSDCSTSSNHKYIQQNLRKAGVCLHVNDGEACIEFCAQCSSKANQNRDAKLFKS